MFGLKWSLLLKRRWSRNAAKLLKCAWLSAKRSGLLLLKTYSPSDVAETLVSRGAHEDSFCNEQNDAGC
eukprot:3858117-Amphidinium_carterae.1